MIVVAGHKHTDEATGVSACQHLTINPLARRMNIRRTRYSAGFTRALVIIGAIAAVQTVLAFSFPLLAFGLSDAGSLAQVFVLAALINLAAALYLLFPAGRGWSAIGPGARSWRCGLARVLGRSHTGPRRW